MSEKLKTVLVTGASTGIGLELVKLLLQNPSYRIVATARSSSLKRFADAGLVESEKLLIRPLDVRHYDEATSLIEELDKKFGGVDILVNNAGLAYRSVVEHMNADEEEDEFRVNYFGPLHLIRLVMPSMRERREGRIINISSVGGMMAMPTMSSYSASKFALEGASESLWYELKPWNIKVSLVRPGFIHSDGFMNTRFTSDGEHSSQDPTCDYHAYYKHMGNFVSDIMDKSPDTSISVARVILKTMERKSPPLRIAGTLDARFFGLLRRFLPQRFYHWLLYRGLPHINEWRPDEKPSPVTRHC
ncbi:SDR family oxidoreductase [bacterium]|nr:SDR family oxidoreductase [bacterium]